LNGSEIGGSWLFQEKGGLYPAVFRGKAGLEREIGRKKKERK
jgi:hypothetical protein